MKVQGSKMREQPSEILACEIHDGPCQYLVSAKMFFDAFRCESGEKAAGKWVNFANGMSLLNQAVDELRRLIGGAGPAYFDGADLLAAIGRLTSEARTRGGPDIEFCHDFDDYDADPLPLHLELAVFRIVQECISNACRHSKSQRMLIGLSRDDKSLCIQAQDWGIGFDPSEIRAKCFGLAGIWRRADLLGGIATVQSRPGEGTCITVDLPLAAAHRTNSRSNGAQP